MTVRAGTGPTSVLTIVGVDTMPTIGAGEGPTSRWGPVPCWRRTSSRRADRDPFNDP